jgi:hypothetical protein
MAWCIDQTSLKSTTKGTEVVFGLNIYTTFRPPHRQDREAGIRKEEEGEGVGVGKPLIMFNTHIIQYTFGHKRNDIYMAF